MRPNKKVKQLLKKHRALPDKQRDSEEGLILLRAYSKAIQARKRGK